MKRKSLDGWMSRIMPMDFSFDGLTQDDLDEALLEHRALPLLFGCISSQAMLDDLVRLGVEKRLLARGYSELKAEIANLPLGQEGLKITASHPESKERLHLMELRAFWGRLPLPEGSPSSECAALIWDWLELRDPMGTFSPNRPPLPGQSYPGLSMFHDLVALMREYVGRTRAEALVTIPQYFHNAVLYQKDSGLGYRFLDPLRQGQMVAQMRDLFADGSLFSAAWAFAEDRVEVLAPGAQQWSGFPWTPSELVLPLTPWVKAALEKENPEVDRGSAYRFRARSTPHPDIEGSFHLAG